MPSFTAELLAFPFYSIPACLFWIALLLLVFAPVRRRAAALFTLPGATSQSHLPCLDAFRGLAALTIALFHTWQWPRPALDELVSWAPFVAKGDKAVPIFVIISGLLIHRALMHVSTIEALRRYIARRFFRVFPVYLVTVLVAAFLVRPPTNIPRLQFGIADLFMLRILEFPGYSIPQAWSLYVEVLFYAVAPIFVIAAGRRRLTWALAALLVFAVSDIIGPRELSLWKYFLFGINSAELIGRVTLPPLVATAMAVLGAALVAVDIHTNYDWLGHGLTTIAGGYMVITTTPPLHVYTISLGVGTAVLILGAVQSPLFARVLEIAPLRFLGSISYSLFMWHSFLIVASFPVTFNGRGNPAPLPGLPPFASLEQILLFMIPGLLAVAALSYVLIERPFLLWRGKGAAIKAGSSE